MLPCNVRRCEKIIGHFFFLKIQQLSNNRDLLDFSKKKMSELFFRSALRWARYLIDSFRYTRFPHSANTRRPHLVSFDRLSILNFQFPAERYLKTIEPSV